MLIVRHQYLSMHTYILIHMYIRTYKWEQIFLISNFRSYLFLLISGNNWIFPIFISLMHLRRIETLKYVHMYTLVDLVWHLYCLSASYVTIRVSFILNSSFYINCSCYGCPDI